MDSISKLADEFEACRKTLIALGDETRQHLILEIMKESIPGIIASKDRNQS